MERRGTAAGAARGVYNDVLFGFSEPFEVAIDVYTVEARSLAATSIAVSWSVDFKFFASTSTVVLFGATSIAVS
jgi:hypothetical protein